MNKCSTGLNENEMRKVAIGWLQDRLDSCIFEKLMSECGGIIILALLKSNEFSGRIYTIHRI